MPLYNLTNTIEPSSLTVKSTLDNTDSFWLWDVNNTYLQTSLTDISNKISANLGISTINSEINTNITNISSNLGAINTINNTTIPNLQSQLDTLNVTTIPSIQSSISTINNTSIPNLQSQLDTLNNTSLPNLQGQLDTLNNTTIPNLQTQLTSNTSDISTLNTTTLPNLQADLNGKLDNLPGVITTTLISDGAITTPKLTANVITANEIAAGAVTTSKIYTGAVTTNEIATNTIVGNNIASATITSTEIAAATILGSNIAAGTIVANNIAAGTITATQISSGTITTNEIAAGTILGSNIASDTITATQIAASTITTNEIATNAINTNQIVAGAVTADRISVTDLSALNATIGSWSITSTQITGLDGSGNGLVLDASNRSFRMKQTGRNDPLVIGYGSTIPTTVPQLGTSQGVANFTASCDWSLTSTASYSTSIAVGYQNSGLEATFTLANWSYVDHVKITLQGSVDNTTFSDISSILSVDSSATFVTGNAQSYTYARLKIEVFTIPGQDATASVDVQSASFAQYQTAMTISELGVFVRNSPNSYLAFGSGYSDVIFQSGSGSVASSWGSITGKPTTLSGYSVTATDVLNTLNAATGTISDNRLPATQSGKTFTSQVVSSVATGTAPFSVASTTQVNNLNADLWQGWARASYLNQDVRTSASPTFTGATFTSAVYGQEWGLNINDTLGFILARSPAHGSFDLNHSIYFRRGYGSVGGSIDNVMEFHEAGTINFYTNGAIGSQSLRMSILQAGGIVAYDHIITGGASYGQLGLGYDDGTNLYLKTLDSNRNIKLQANGTGAIYFGSNTYTPNLAYFGASQQLLFTAGKEQLLSTDASPTFASGFYTTKLNIGISTDLGYTLGVNGSFGIYSGNAGSGASVLSLDSYEAGYGHWISRVVNDYYGGIYNANVMHGMSFIGGRNGFDNFRWFDSSYSELMTLFKSGNLHLGYGTNPTDTGYKTAVNGTFWANEITTDILKAHLFKKDITKSVAGDLLVSNSSLVTGTSGTTQVIVEDGTLFSAGDLLKISGENSSGFHTVSATVSSVSGNTITLTSSPTGFSSIEHGDDCVVVSGNLIRINGQGSYMEGYLNADATTGPFGTAPAPVWQLYPDKFIYEGMIQNIYTPFAEGSGVGSLRTQTYSETTSQSFSANANNNVNGTGYVVWARAKFPKRYGLNTLVFTGTGYFNASVTGVGLPTDTANFTASGDIRVYILEDTSLYQVKSWSEFINQNSPSYISGDVAFSLSIDISTLTDNQQYTVIIELETNNFTAITGSGNTYNVNFSETVGLYNDYNIIVETS